MSWHDLLFAHWQIPVEQLRQRIPKPLQIDTFDGAAWIGVVPFHMSDVHARILPTRIASRFPELNVRTYVVLDGKPGVWFFSLDASSYLAVRVARWWYGLNYRHAHMRCSQDAGWIRYESIVRGGADRFRASYRPLGNVFRSSPGQLEHWLTERYCLYLVHRHGTVLRGNIHHAPWQLQRAELCVEENTMLDDYGVDPAAVPPHLLFSKRLDTVAWSTEPAQ